MCMITDEGFITIVSRMVGIKDEHRYIENILPLRTRYHGWYKSYVVYAERSFLYPEKSHSAQSEVYSTQSELFSG